MMILMAHYLYLDLRCSYIYFENGLRELPESGTQGFDKKQHQEVGRQLEIIPIYPPILD